MRVLLHLLMGLCLLFGAPRFCFSENHETANHKNATASPGSEDHLQVSVVQGLVTVQASQVDLRSVLSELSKASGVPINASQLEKQPPIYVSVSIKERPLPEALKMIIEQVPGGGFSIARDQKKPASGEIQQRVYVVTKRGMLDGEESASGAPSPLNIEEKTPDETATVIKPATIEPAVRDSLWESNHRSLLEIQKDIADYLRMAREKPDSVPYMPDFQKWADALYRDAILAKLLNEGVDESKKNEVLSEFEQPTEPRKLSLIEDKIPTTKEGYAQVLQALLAAVFKRGYNEVDLVQSLDLASRFEDLVERRKRYSDTFYETELVEYLRNDSISLDQKLRYVEPFVARGDWSLIATTTQYFGDADIQMKLPPSERGELTSFLARIQEKQREGP